MKKPTLTPPATPLVALALLSFGCLAPPSRPLPFTKGNYLQLNGFWAFDNIDAPPNVSFDDSIGFGARAGHRFNESVAGELLFEYVDDFEGEVMSADRVDARIYSLAANGKYFFSESAYQPFASLGLGILEGKVNDSRGPAVSIDRDETDPMARFALGVDYHDAKNLWWDVELTYHLPLDDFDDYQFVSISFGIGLGL